MPSAPKPSSKKALTPAPAEETGVSPLASEPTDLAALVNDEVAAGGEPSPPSDAPSEPTGDAPPADPVVAALEAEVERLSGEIASLTTDLGSERDQSARLAAEVERLTAENVALLKKLDDRPLTPIPKVVAPAVRPTTVPEDFVLTRWKGPGTYEGRCYSLMGEVQNRARGALTGWFPMRMIQKQPDLFEKV